MVIAALLPFIFTTSLLIAADTAQQPVPNPAMLTYGFRGPSKTYSVDCWSAPEARGTWLAVTESTYTTQPALIYNPVPPRLEDFRARILYCFASDGKPGLISGAPPGLLLPPGTRVEVRTSILVLMRHVVAGKDELLAEQLALGDEGWLESGPEGIVAHLSPHQITVYPAGARLTVGRGSEVGFYRPGIKLTPPTHVGVPDGCSALVYDNNGRSKTLHYAQDCTKVAASKPWTAKH
ncbi:MAG: hypothetical protein M3126_07375 [Candidatus Eremiobacteraeota bacterium]|nr:hypothetical protein [Candidatus Eremiobacteraeota bacterium]